MFFSSCTFVSLRASGSKTVLQVLSQAPKFLQNRDIWRQAHSHSSRAFVSSDASLYHLLYTIPTKRGTERTMKTRQTKTAMARLLLESPDSVLSGEVLARELHVSRQSVWKIIRELEDEGFEIEPFPQKGYRLRSVPSWDLAPSFLGARLPKECPWGKEIHVYDTLPSTQSEAKRLGRSGGCDGLVVVAEEQTKGRGRRDRVWFSPKGRGCIFGVLQTTSVLQVGAAGESGRWPYRHGGRGGNNGTSPVPEMAQRPAPEREKDLWHPLRDFQRFGGYPGLLYRYRHQHFPAGGAFQRRARERGSPLRELLSRGQGELLVAILPRFAEYIARLESSGADELLARYRERCSTLGREVTVHTESDVFTGTAAGIGSPAS